MYGTWWSLVPPVVAILLAFITKEALLYFGWVFESKKRGWLFGKEFCGI